MRTNLFRRILIAGALLAAAASTQAAVDPIPCAVGNRWEYDCVKLNKGNIEYQGQKLAQMYDTSSGTAVYEVTSKDSAAPAFTYCETTKVCSTITGRTSTEKSEMKLISDNEALKIINTESTSSEGDKPDKQAYDPPLIYWVKNPAIGKSWDVGTLRSEDAQEPLSAKVVGRETVTVPAGTFKDCMKVIYTSVATTGSFEMMGQKFTVTSGKTCGVYWIADGVGVVKELEVSTSSAQAPGPAGGFVTITGGTCTITELKPGFVVK